MRAWNIGNFGSDIVLDYPENGHWTGATHAIFDLQQRLSRP